jgi:hypothetical protein
MGPTVHTTSFAPMGRAVVRARSTATARAVDPRLAIVRTEVILESGARDTATR